MDQEAAQMDEAEEVMITAAPAKRLKSNTVGVGKVLLYFFTSRLISMLYGIRSM